MGDRLRNVSLPLSNSWVVHVPTAFRWGMAASMVGIMEYSVVVAHKVCHLQAMLRSCVGLACADHMHESCRGSGHCEIDCKPVLPKRRSVQGCMHQSQRRALACTTLRQDNNMHQAPSSLSLLCTEQEKTTNRNLSTRSNGRSWTCESATS